MRRTGVQSEGTEGSSFKWKAEKSLPKELTRKRGSSGKGDLPAERAASVDT